MHVSPFLYGALCFVPLVPLTTYIRSRRALGKRQSPDNPPGQSNVCLANDSPRQPHQTKAMCAARDHERSSAKSLSQYIHQADSTGHVRTLKPTPQVINPKTMRERGFALSVSPPKSLINADALEKVTLLRSLVDGRLADSLVPHHIGHIRAAVGHCGPALPLGDGLPAVADVD